MNTVECEASIVGYPLGLSLSPTVFHQGAWSLSSSFSVNTFVRVSTDRDDVKITAGTHLPLEKQIRTQKEKRK